MERLENIPALLFGRERRSVSKLGQSKKYRLVCHTGNLFFVAEEYLEPLGIDPEMLNDPGCQFINEWVCPTRPQVFLRKLRQMTWQRAWVKLENALRN